jgi:hypothetical protein
VVGAARLWPVLDADVVDLEREALAAGAGRVLTGVEAPGEADGLTLDEAVGGGLGFAPRR